MSVRHAVIDTNVLVAAGINPSGKPGQVLAAVAQLTLQPIVSAEVMAEYRDVMARPHFRFQPEWLDRLLDNFAALGVVLEHPPIDTAGLPDPTDAPVVALARYARCPVITGNAKHFPAKAGVMVLTPAGWVEEQAGI